MRALFLSLTAFGPYWEKQHIDFAELGGESIFLITGPTGAGKTTIFDAICYALYGRASGSDRDQDSLRSHFATVDEPTEVQFRFALHQKVYEVTRNPKQQKKKERGEGYTEEPAKAVLYEVTDNGKTLVTSRIKDVNETIEAKLGFDYEQFRKMVLIPQGEFRKLISENSKEREAILQKIFHTYFYEKITEELKNQAKELKEEIAHIEQLIQYEMTKIQWTTQVVDEDDTFEAILKKLSDELNSTKEKLTEQIKQKSHQQQVLKEAQNKLHDGKALEEKYVEHEKLQREQEALFEFSATIFKVNEKLRWAKAAQEIIPFENQCNTRKKEWEDQLSQITKQQETIEKLEKEYKLIEVNYKKTANKEAEREQLKEQINQAKIQLEQVTDYVELEKTAKQIKLRKGKQQEQLRILEKKHDNMESKLVQIETKLNSEQELTKAYYMKREEIDRGNERINQLEDLLAENDKLLKLRRDYQSYHHKSNELQRELEQIQNQYDKKEKEQKAHYAALIAHHLDDDSPCPVCGSLDHPKKAVAHDATVRESELEQLKKIVKAKEKDYLMFQQKFAECKSDGQSQRVTVMKLYDQLGNEPTELDQETIKASIKKWKQNVFALKQEIDKLEKNLAEMQVLKKERIDYKHQKEEFKQTFDQISKDLQRTTNESVKIETKLEELAKNLPDGVENVESFKTQIDRMERTWKQEITYWEKVSQDYQQSYETLQKEKTILEQQKHFEKNTKANFEEQFRLFSEAVREFGFSSIESFHEAKQPLHEQQSMEERIKTYETRKEQISYRLNELTRQIENKTRPSITMLESLVDAKQKELQVTSDNLHSIRLKIENDEQVEKSMKEKLRNQHHLTKDYYTIGELAELAHGNNQLRLSFERYVLASFLDEILIQANLRLDRMTEHRYQLIRSGQVAKRGAQSGLDLEVLDHHTGLQRSVKTLSGGEGFKAALSLALGLADVVQAHAGGVQMDTLFIDEGFGTLDQLSLQQAIDCLKDLQKSNRLLGIISHVPHLKNEIHAKLQISPSHKGSRLAFSFGQGGS